MMHDRFKHVELLATEIEELPDPRLVALWHALVIYPTDKVPYSEYPEVEVLVLEIIGVHAKRLDLEFMGFKYLFSWIQEVQGYLLDNGGEVPMLPPDSFRPTVEALRHATISCGRICPSKDREWYSKDMTWAKVVETWPAVKHPAGHNAFDLASERASKVPITLNREAFGPYYSGLLEWVASIGYYLQIALGDVDILIPTELVGKKLGYADKELARKAGSRLIKPLKQLGLLSEKPGYVAGYRAARYRFNLRKLNLFTPPS